VKVFKGAVIGCGFVSRHHLEAWRRMANVRIVAACDSQLERARAVSENAYASAEEMLNEKDLDFLDIIFRSETHSTYCRRLRKEGWPLHARSLWLPTDRRPAASLKLPRRIMCA
jgi:predicted dehydrogenase